MIQNHPAWAGNDLSSSWIGPVNPGTADVNAGSYNYRTTFNLNGFDASTVVMQMSLAVDNGLTAASVEERLAGGECTFFGCIPSKTLIRPGDVIAAVRRVPGAAEAVTGAIDVEAAFAQRDYMTSDGSDRTQTPWLDEEGIELVRGHGRLAGLALVAGS